MGYIVGKLYFLFLQKYLDACKTFKLLCKRIYPWYINSTPAHQTPKIYKNISDWRIHNSFTISYVLWFYQPNPLPTGRYGKVGLTVVPQFHSHYEELRFLPADSLREQLSLSYELQNRKGRNVLDVPGFNTVYDPTR